VLWHALLPPLDDPAAVIAAIELRRKLLWSRGANRAMLANAATRRGSGSRVASPTTPSTASSSRRWKRRTASVNGLKRPSIGPRARPWPEQPVL
jgi:hypothetical protein